MTKLLASWFDPKLTASLVSCHDDAEHREQCAHPVFVETVE
jgi:hypothetical protein